MKGIGALIGGQRKSREALRDLPDQIRAIVREEIRDALRGRRNLRDDEEQP